MADKPITVIDAHTWLEEAAKYFESRPTNGEDMAFWANKYNAQIARKISDLIKEMTK